MPMLWCLWELTAPQSVNGAPCKTRTCDLLVRSRLTAKKNKKKKEDASRLIFKNSSGATIPRC